MPFKQMTVVTVWYFNTHITPNHTTKGIFMRFSNIKGSSSHHRRQNWSRSRKGSPPPPRRLSVGSKNGSMSVKPLLVGSVSSYICTHTSSNSSSQSDSQLPL